MHELIRQVVDWYGKARWRAQRRKSPWNLILIPLGLVTWLGVWVGLFRIVWLFHTLLYPQHDLRDFWQEGARTSSFVPSFLMVFALMPGSLCLGLALTNCVAWIVAPARRVFEAEARGYSGTSFREATVGLLKLSAWTVPAGLVIALLAALALVSLK